MLAAQHMADFMRQHRGRKAPAGVRIVKQASKIL